MNHFMIYEQKAQLQEQMPQQQQQQAVTQPIGQQAQPTGQTMPTALTRPLTGAAQRGAQRFNQQVQKAILTPMRGAQLAAQNLKSILANDPKAEQKKVRIIKLLYKWFVQGDMSIEPEDQAAEQQ